MISVGALIEILKEYQYDATVYILADHAQQEEQANYVAGSDFDDGFLNEDGKPPYYGDDLPWGCRPQNARAVRIS